MGRILACEIILIDHYLGDVIADKCIMIARLGSRIHRWHGEDKSTHEVAFSGVIRRPDSYRNWIGISLSGPRGQPYDDHTAGGFGRECLCDW